ncbi:MAG: gliding motility-associated C-terminal domain-containing protein [Muribaculaceae bacterium]|nr:gliding motility-associated C-terminal domain-containing protein [Muribaculaceae bacterium]
MGKFKYLLIVAAALVATATSAQVAFEGNTKPVYEETPPANTGLNALYVLYSTQGVSMTYTASDDPDNVTWYDFGEEGGGSAIDPMTGIQRNGNVTTLPQVIGDRGYIIQEGDRRTYVWVVDYSKCRLQLNSATVDPESDCGTTIINVDGEGNDLVYYTINGGRRVIDRQIKVRYKTLEWNDDETRWVEIDVTEEKESFKTSIAVPAPLCNTTFTVEGDKFLEFWKKYDVGYERKTTELYSATAVRAETKAVQEERDNDNEQKPNGSYLGGSAPVHITFTAYCTDAVSFKEWQVSDTPEFTYLLMNFAQEEVDYTFEDTGTTYWRFYYANSDGSCEDYSETYTVNVGESVLECPNIFSPANKDGINDEWKVSYKSIVDFHCWIYNRWGNLIKEFTDPSEGWDGTYGGKLVNAGVYFYVIRATGSDGKKYKLSGDINILRYERRGMGGGVEDPAVE